MMMTPNLSFEQAYTTDIFVVYRLAGARHVTDFCVSYSATEMYAVGLVWGLGMGSYMGSNLWKYGCIQSMDRSTQFF